VKLAFSLVIEDDDSAPRWLEMICAAGFDGVEPTFRLDGTLPTAADPRGSAEKLASMAQRSGLKIPSMRGGPGFWPTFASSDPQRRAAAVALADKALQAVKIMGGDTLLIVPGQWEADQAYSAVWKNAVESARRIAEVAERTGVKVALENVENRFLLSPREWMEFLDEVNSAWVRMYFDVGNVIYTRLGYPEQWLRELTSKYITRIHFKDAEPGVVKNLRSGQVHWPNVREAMNAMRYDDWVGVELTPPEDNVQAFLTETCRIAKEILQ